MELLHVGNKKCAQKKKNQILHSSNSTFISTALHISSIILTSFMKQSSGMLYNEQICLVKRSLVDFLAFVMCLSSVVLSQDSVGRE